MEILSEFGIPGRIGYFVTDNASNNDTALESIAEALGFNAQHRRLRCVGHILNLVAQSILFGNNPADLQVDIERATQDIEELTLWRHHGPIGKLHNIVKYICHSPQRLQRFRETQQLDDIEISVPAHVQGTSSAQSWNLERDNETRWNSTYKMITRALDLRKAVDRFMELEEMDHVRSARRVARGQGEALESQAVSFRQDILTADDWEILKTYRIMLEPIWDSTMKLEGDAVEGRNGAIWEVLPVFEYILDHFWNLSERFDLSDETEERLKTSLELGIQKLDIYYKFLDDSPAYIAAVVLHPSFKWEWIESIWSEKPNGKTWIRKAKAAVQRLWRDEYKTLPAAEVLGGDDAPPAKRLKPNSKINSFLAKRSTVAQRPSPDSSSSDEYERYIKQPTIEAIMDDELNPITWWESKRSQMPRLSKMALDLLSIPAMSAKAERIFSHCGNIVRPNRARLHGDTLAAVVCLKQWESEGLVDWNGSNTDESSSIYNGAS